MSSEICRNGFKTFDVKSQVFSLKLLLYISTSLPVLAFFRLDVDTSLFLSQQGMKRFHSCSRFKSDDFAPGPEVFGGRFVRNGIGEEL